MLAQASAAAAASRPGSVPPGGKPGATAAGKPPTAPGSAIQAAAAAAVRAAEAIPAKKGGAGRKRRASDLRLPDRGDLLVPDSPLFAQLQDAERRVDMLISRKKHELQEMYASFRRGEQQQRLRPAVGGLQPPGMRGGLTAGGAGEACLAAQAHGFLSMPAAHLLSSHYCPARGSRCHVHTHPLAAFLQGPPALRWRAALCGASCASTCAPSTSTRWGCSTLLPTCARLGTVPSCHCGARQLAQPVACLSLPSQGGSAAAPSRSTQLPLLLPPAAGCAAGCGGAPLLGAHHQRAAAGQGQGGGQGGGPGRPGGG